MSDVSTLPAPAAPTRLQLVLAFAAVYVIWGSTYLAIRFAIETLPGFTMSGVRFLLAGTLLYLWARRRGGPGPTAAQWRSAAVIGTLLLVGGNGGVVWSEYRLTSGLAALLVSTVPLWIALFFWLLPGGEAPRRRTVLGLAVGFGGVALLMAPGATAEGEPLHLPSLLVILLACVAWSWGSLYGRRAELPASPWLGTALQMLAGGAGLLLLGLVTGEWRQVDLAQVSPRSVLAFGYLVVFGSLIGFSAYSWLLRTVRPTLAATYAYVNPVVAVFLGWLLAGETLGPRSFAAAVLIVTSVVLVSTDRPRLARPAVPTPLPPRPETDAESLPGTTVGGEVPERRCA